SDVLLQITPYFFDAAVWEIFAPLSRGARLVVPPPLAQQDPSYLTRAVAEEGVTVLQLVPSMLGPFLDDPGVAGCDSLRFLLSGGEALPGPLAERVLARLDTGDAGDAGDFTLGNFYGPSECSIDATSRTCGPGERRSIVPIGLPLDNVRVHVLDATLEPLPLGAPGELFVGGAGLARGYLDRPDLTAERFLPDPWPDRRAVPGERLYRTGDRVRRLPGGEIEYLGRLDQQVKVRGLRIELGEIEAALSTAPGVREGVVAAVGQGTERRLVAYVVPSHAGDADATGSVDVAALRRHCQRHLPAYMVPSAFFVLARLPLLPSGKLDRRALAEIPEIDGGAEPADRFVAPATPLQEILAGIWAEVLGRERVSVEDDFFTILGGHSLLATQVVARVRERLGLDLPLRSLFEAPTVRGWAAVVEAGGPGLSGRESALRRRPRAGAPPLSFAQERLWFLDQLTPGLVAYNMPLWVDLEGRLDRAALDRALATLLSRHEVLRTAFRTEGGRPVQVIEEETVLPLPVVDLGGIPGERAAAESARLAGDEARRPFDLSRAPLLRAWLLRRGDCEHRLLLTLHHIACDGWSLGVLVAEVGAFYAGETLPALPIQYADYAAWQREELQGEVLEEQLEHWRRQLEGLPVLDLPTDRPRPAVESYRGGWVAIDVPGELADRLRRQSRAAGVTLFMTLLAGFQALLARWSGQDDVAVGTAVANRRHRELEGLIGFFVNTLVLRADLSGEPSFLALLTRVREVALGAYAHQDLPFEKLVEELHPARDASRAPLVSVTFMLQNTPLPALVLPGLAARSGAVSNQTAKFDLSVSFEERLEERAGGLAGSFEYGADLFEPATVARLGRHFLRLLDAAVTSPEERVAELPLLDSEEQRQVIEEPNRTAVDFGPARAVHEIFATEARATPDAIAVISHERALTYAELDRRADRLAHRLRALGVVPEARVGLCLARDPDLLVGVLGVWKAGGAYLPLDPAYPAERLAAMIEDAAPVVVLTAPRYRDLLRGAPVLGIDQWMESTLPSDLPPSPVAPENPAYVIFTSGSTGRPKGVVVEHRSLSNFLLSLRSLGLLDHGRALLSVTTLAFDIAGLELLLPLISGGTVALATREESADGERLAALLADPRVQTLQATPATWRLLLDAGWKAGEGFRALCGGEALPRELAARLLRSASSLWNLYGPTETTIWSSVLAVENRHLSETLVPLGQPIGNTRLYVLERGFAPAPVGVPGELCFAGAGLARGYLGRPDLTAERFVPDPFGAGDRLYRTGDRARFRADGELEYLGRLDQQVKLRGFRIEPGEIETVLTTSPEVRQAVVMLREGQRLVAYVVPAREDGAVLVELRRLCEQRLPAYMVPSAFVVLPELPLLPNGKLDRRALPAPELSRLPSGAPAVPGSPFEEIVATLWAEVLGAGMIGLDDDFFADLGGHSLLAAQVMARARDLGIDLPLRSLFEAPTARRWAALAAGARAPEAPESLVRRARTGPPPLSYAQERLWFLDRMIPDLAAYNLPFAVRLTGRLDRAALGRAWAAVVARQEALRTVFRLEQGRPVQVIAPAGERGEGLPILDLRGTDRQGEIDRLVGDEARRPFDLQRGPLYRARLLALAEDEHLLLLTLHHIVSDGWSFGVLVGELSALYAGETLPLLPVQYTDYAVWQREWLAGERLERQMAYWRGQLDAVPALQLPADRPRPAVQSHRGGEVWLELPGDLVLALKDLCRSHGVTLFMALLAGFDILLSRSSGQEDFTVGTAVANRGRRELEGLIGFFVNTLALRVRLDGNVGCDDLLAQVRETTLGAYAHQDLPF
ncbi:MAG TPA: amino acid adenylation domain-containing protein, partial [Thermoanaerobaculia bacterium]|nr:amino acid adenylation domain-containing protein [Thermoanaerobaculia bacterium]